MLKGIKRAASAIAIAVALYSLLGFLILPGIGLRIANQQLAQYAAVPASLQRLQLNPFSLEVRDGKETGRVLMDISYNF